MNGLYIVVDMLVNVLFFCRPVTSDKTALSFSTAFVDSTYTGESMIPKVTEELQKRKK
jgi:hypothetical protein